jgi:hypothetical protein
MLCFGGALTHPSGLKIKPSKEQQKAEGKLACLLACLLAYCLFFVWVTLQP